MRILLALAALLALPASAAAQSVPPANCGGVFDVTVTAGFSTSSLFCDGTDIEVVTPPAHGKVTERTVSETVVSPVYEADAGAGGQTDRYEFRAVAGDRATPVYAVTVRIDAVPDPTVLPAPAYAGPAPVISARALARRHRRLTRRGLPLALGCDVACELAVAVTDGKTVAGASAAAAAGRRTVPLTGAVRRGTRLLVVIVATAADRPPSRLRFTVRAR